MRRFDGKDYVYVIWKSSKNRRQYVIGELVKNGEYEFRYCHEIEEAISSGFQGFECFQDFNKKYLSKELFAIFLSRLPSENRKDINRILKRYKLEKYDAYELLKLSGAKLPTDNYEFIDPLPNEIEHTNIKRCFYVAGTRYYIGCEGENCQDAFNIDKEEKISLKLENNNEYDKFAIQVINQSKQIIGYIPRYYSKKLYNFIELGYNYDCYIKDINKQKDCNICARVELILYSENNAESPLLKNKQN